MKRWRARALLLLAVFAVTVGGLIAWRLRPRESVFFTNGDSIRELASSASIREILWEPPVPLDRQVNIPADVYEPSISRDGQTLFFVRGRAGRNADLFVCRRTFEGWTEPAPIDAANSEYDELGPHPSPDGRTLYFYSDRPGGSGGFDLWCTRLVDDEWAPPENLGPGVNSEYNEYGPSPSPDGKSLYFASNRPRPNERVAPQAGRWNATIREDQSHHDYDLFVAPLDEAGAGEARPLTALNTESNEGAACVSPYGDFLYFGSDRPGGRGGFDLYRARRTAAGFEKPENLGPSVNTVANDLDPALALGGFGLYFSSDRARDAARPDAPGEYKLYYTASREVYRDVVVFRPTIDWRTFWRRLAPNLLWALLALLAMLLLLAAIRDVQRRNLGLLTRCLLLSLFIHLLLMLLFNAWRVGTALAQELGRRGPIQVAFSSASGESIENQIRGNLTMPDPIEPAATPLERVAAIAEPIAASESLRTVAPRPQIDDKAQPRRFETANDAPPPEMRRQRNDESKLATVDRPKLDVSVPREAQPTARGEPDRPTAHPQLDGRSERIVLVTATQPVERFELPRGAPDGASDQTLIANVRVEDAAPRATAAVSSTSSHAAAPSVGMLADVATPGESEPRSRATEQITSPQPAAGRGARSRSVDAPERTQAVETTPLAAASPAGGDASLAPLSGRRISEAVPARTAPGVRVAVVPDAPAMARALPRLEEAPRAPAGGTAETTLTARPAPLGRSRGGEDEALKARGTPIVSNLPTAGATAGSGGESLITPGVNDAPPPVRSSDDSPIGRETPAGNSPDALGLALRVPTEQLSPENPYVQRAPEERKDIVQRMGGSERTEAAVNRALKWLAAHQSNDGRWSSTEFDSECGDCEGAAQLQADVAMTGLSVLCFLGADHTHAKDGPYRENVRRAIRWLRKHQEADGDLRNGESMYSHGIATIALAEAYGMTRDEELHDAVRRATAFIWKARNRRGAGWRYEPGQYGDTSVLGWQVMALRSAQRAGVDVPDGAFELAQRWLLMVSSRSRPGLYAYQPGRAVTPSMTAEGMFVLQLTGVAHDDARMATASALISRNRPDWDAGANTYYWYYATLALFQRQGDEWPRWNRRLVRELLAHQRKGGAAAGSWDPEGEWAPAAGRVYQTALCTLMLEVYYRYLPMYAQPKPATQPAPS